MVAELDGHREDVAPRDEEGALALRGETERFDVLFHGEVRGSGGEAVRGDVDGEAHVLARDSVEDAERAAELVHDLPRVVRGGPAHVPRGGCRQLLGLCTGEVGGVEVEGSVAVGDEVDPIANPHGVALGPHRGRDARRGARREIVDPEILGPAPLIALPVAEIAEQRAVDDALAVGGEIARTRCGHGKLHREAAPGVDGVQGGQRRAVVGIPHRTEQDLLAVRRPSVDLIVVAVARGQGAACRVPGDLPWDASRRGNDVDLLVAVVLAGERDPLAIGRELGEQLEPGMSREARCGAAAGARRPEVPAIDERHAVAMDVGKAKEPRLGSSVADGAEQECGRDRETRRQPGAESRNHVHLHERKPPEGCARRRGGASAGRTERPASSGSLLSRSRPRDSVRPGGRQVLRPSTCRPRAATVPRMP